MIYQLDPRLAKDSEAVLSLTLCEVRLMKNAAFPWVLLIPQRANCVEILDLSDTDRTQLFQEMLFVSEKMKQLFKPTKLNIANLGNQVPQLHVHVIARYENDAAWPNPVWGTQHHQCYLPAEKAERISKIRELCTLS